MPTDTIQQLAGKHATKHRARFGMPAQRFHCTGDYIAGAEAWQAAAIAIVEELLHDHQRGDIYGVQPIMKVLAALKEQKETT